MHNFEKCLNLKYYYVALIISYTQIKCFYIYSLSNFVKVLVLVTQPELLDDDRFPEDVKKRARTILDGCRGGSVGNYNTEYLNNYLDLEIKHYNIFNI